MIHQSKGMQGFMVGAIEKHVIPLVDDDENVGAQYSAFFIRSGPGGASRVGLVDEVPCGPLSQGAGKRRCEIFCIEKAYDDVRRNGGIHSSYIYSWDPDRKVIQYSQI